MSLEEYAKKRDFKKTPEPEGKRGNSNQFRFVIQRHQASHLHYDLRLELHGALKSWAVPKGPSMEAGVKRLAVQTEDHPVEYLTFEGNIPKGNYGAGTMSIWDFGTFKAAKGKDNSELLNQWKEGNLKIIFEGDQLKGEFALVRTRSGEGKNWLLIKKKDQFSTDKKYSNENRSETQLKKLNTDQFVKPMLASPKKKIFNHPNWIFELKWDGYRMLSSIRNGEVHCYSRNGNSFNQKFSKIARVLEGIPHDVILDGEMVALDKKGLPNFQAIQNYPENGWKRLKYYVFDVLFLNGHSTLELGLKDRKSLLPDIIDGLDDVVYCDDIERMGTAFYEKAITAGMEGVIAKKADSTYVPGHRSEDWLKIKAQDSQEAIICGYTDSEKQAFGSLILGVYEEEELRYIGNCGTGFSQKEQQALLKKFEPLERQTSPFSEKINLRGREPNWMIPELIAEVTFSEWTSSGRLRHPVFKALRTDKEAREIKKQKEVVLLPASDSKTTSANTTLEIDGYSVPFSNLKKIYWPESGFRKYDLIDYYLQVSDYILPYLKDRPQNLHRHPNGIQSEGFYQKNMEQDLLKDFMETVPIYSESNEKELNYMLCQNKATLLYLANLGCIELNPWNSKIHSLENPDYGIIDLDPTKENTFAQVIEVALAAKEVLDQWKITAFCKTSGSAGIHILMSLAAQYTYEQTRDFTKLICLEIQSKLPQLTTLERALKNRNGRIYLDYLQNRKAQTLAAPYCVRPKEGAPVSAPLEWNEVKPGLEILDFTISNMPKRLQEKGDLFQGIFETSINMESILKNISKTNRR